MGLVGKAGDLGFKAFITALGLTTIYLTGNISVNAYRGYSWHKAQTKMDKAGTTEQSP